MPAASVFTRVTALVLTAMILCVLTGCGDSHERATRDMISLMNRIADTIGSVKDKPTAEAAKDKLKALSEEMKFMKARIEKLGKPSGKVVKTLENYHNGMEAANRRVGEAFRSFRFAGHEAGDLLEDTMNEMEAALK